MFSPNWDISEALISGLRQVHLMLSSNLSCFISVIPLLGSYATALI